MEILIAVTALGLIISGAISLFLSSLKTSQKANINSLLRQEGNYALDYIKTKIRNANSVTCSDKNNEITLDQLIITYDDSEENILVKKLGSDQFNNLISSGFKVTSLKFDCDLLSSSGVVNVNFILNDPNSNQQQMFSALVSLRSY